MHLKDIKLKKLVSYQAKSASGTGRVAAINTKATGDWVVVDDRVNLRYVTVRPSQVSPA